MVQVNREFFVYWSASDPFVFASTSVQVDSMQRYLNASHGVRQELNAAVVLTHASNWFEREMPSATRALAETYLSSGRNYYVVQSPFLHAGGRFHTMGTVALYHSELQFQGKIRDRVYESPLIPYHELGLRSDLVVYPVTFISGR